MSRTALVMAGGTGGHIFPGLAVAVALRDRGWRVHWLGGRGTDQSPSMERTLVPPQGFPFEMLDFGGVRGKGLGTLLRLPLRLMQALRQSHAIIRRINPDVVIGLGGYISFPAGLMTVLCRKPLVLHEQNSVAGLANRLLARFARRVFTAFPQVLPRGQWVGNPLRKAFLDVPGPVERFAGRSGVLRVLVVGGSLGAQVLNQVVPQALALMPPDIRPLVTHQSGARQFDVLQENYRRAGVQAELTPFIEDTARAFADADLVICRAGASTVTELAAVGAAALFVPFAAAVDDHQTHNARFLVGQGAGWMMKQSEFTPVHLAQMLRQDRQSLLGVALKARSLARLEATSDVVRACEEMVA